jgi:glycosyltransferase involved in cell wall biosynthesis
LRISRDETGKSGEAMIDGTSTEAPSRRPRLAAVAPCYNEEDGIQVFYRELKSVLQQLNRYDHEIVFIDDGSTDATLSILNDLAARDPSVKVYSFSRNFGHQIALSAGIDVSTADALVMLDSDLQHPPALIPEMIRLWETGVDVVSARRTTTDGASRFKVFTSRMFYRLINVLSDTVIPDGAADFCLLSKRAQSALRAMPERHRFVRGMIAWIGFPRAYVSYHAPMRSGGETKYTPFRMLALAREAVLSFSATPVRLATRGGAVVTGCGGIYLLYVLIRYFTEHDLERGWGSLIATVLILGGLQLAFIGLIGEYLVRLFEEAKSRPLYLFKQQPPDHS